MEVNSTPKLLTELRFISAKELIRYRNLKEIKHESICLCYVPSHNAIFINPASRSQLSPDEFARELSKFCVQINIKDIYFVKNDDNIIFVRKLVKEIQNNKILSGPRLSILKVVKKIENKLTKGEF